MKAGFFSILFFGGLVFSLVSSSAGNPISEKNKQLCYVMDKYINENLYNYNSRNASFEHTTLSKVLRSVISRRRGTFAKSPWELKRVQVDVGPFSRNPSVTHWLKYDTSHKNNLDQLCKMMNGECIFKVVYKGDIYPMVEATGGQAMHLMYENTLRAIIYDGQNNILRFPTNCSE